MSKINWKITTEVLFFLILANLILLQVGVIACAYILPFAMLAIAFSFDRMLAGPI